MTYHHAADLADTLAADARDEVASDRAGAFIPDDPRQPSYGAEEPGEVPATNGWWCPRCKQGHRSGDPWDEYGCTDCGWRAP